MTDTVDLNLVLGIILPHDRLKARAEAHIGPNRRLLVPFSVGIELLVFAFKNGHSPVAAVGAAAGRFEVENKEVLFTAAQALESGEIKRPFDALHAADAYVRGVRLHTADQEILDSPFPTTPF